MCVCVCVCVCVMLLLLSVEHPFEELLVATRAMPNAFKELSTPVAVKRICKQRKINTYKLNCFSYTKAVDGCTVRYPTSIKSARFKTLLEAFCFSSHTDEL